MSLSDDLPNIGLNLDTGRLRLKECFIAKSEEIKKMILEEIDNVLSMEYLRTHIRNAITTQLTEALDRELERSEQIDDVIRTHIAPAIREILKKLENNEDI